MAMIEGDYGHGTLSYNNKIYKFKVRGMGALGYGVQKLSAVGHVYHLNAIADFAGSYSEARAGLTVAKGVVGLYIRNDKVVVIEQRTLSGGAIGTGAGAIVGAIAGHTVWGAAIGAAAGAAGGYLYDHHEKAKQAEYQKGYQAGQQSAMKSQ